MSENTFIQTNGNGGLQKIVVTHESGASLEVYLKGASVTSWKDSKNNECLYISPKSFFDLEHPVRGGIPLVFPQFGPGDLPLHGFARLAMWALKSQNTQKDGSASLVLSLSDSPFTRGLWNHEFELEYTLILNATSLTTQFMVKNTGSQPFDFAFLFHTYFKLQDIEKAEVAGFNGLSAADRITNANFTVDNAPIVFDKETNVLLYSANCRATLKDKAAARAYEIERTSNMTETVVWNPWAETCEKNADFVPESYKYFACVEPGAVQQKTMLIPGASALFAQTLTVKS